MLGDNVGPSLPPILGQYWANIGPILACWLGPLRNVGPFCKLTGIKHTLCPPHHPSTNGLAEMNVQTFKRLLDKTSSTLPIQHRLAGLLFHYRTTPHATTGKTPAELFLKRASRTRITLSKPSLQADIQAKQTHQKFQHDGSYSRSRQFDLYQAVKVRKYEGRKGKMDSRNSG